MAARNGTPADAQGSALIATVTEESGLLLTEPLVPEGRPTPGSLRLDGDEHANAWASAVVTAPENVTVGAYLVHAGASGARVL